MSEQTLAVKEHERRTRKNRWRNYFSSYLMVAPAMIAIIMFVIYPAINMTVLSLYKGNAVKPYKSFVGLDNYYKLIFVKDDFFICLKNTLCYTVGALVCIVILALLLAQWMYKPRKINSLATAVFFSPHLVASVAAGFVFSWMMSSQSYGLFNTVLGWFGIGPVKFLDSAQYAMASVVFMNTWKSTGYYALMILSSMKQIPTEVYEAAKLDSSSGVKTFFKITIPMISPQLFFILITITTGSFKVFDSIRIMTEGGPGNATRVLSYYIYDYAFQRNNTLGFACAAGIVMMLIMIFLTWFDFAVVEKKVHYQ